MASRFPVQLATLSAARPRRRVLALRLARRAHAAALLLAAEEALHHCRRVEVQLDLLAVLALEVAAALAAAEMPLGGCGGVMLQVRRQAP